MTDDLLTPPEYARYRRCSVRTLDRERADGVGCASTSAGQPSGAPAGDQCKIKCGGAEINFVNSTGSRQHNDGVTPSHYSDFRLLEGLTNAALIDWKLMVRKVNRITRNPASRNMPQPRWM